MSWGVTCSRTCPGGVVHTALHGADHPWLVLGQLVPGSCQLLWHGLAWLGWVPFSTPCFQRQLLLLPLSLTLPLPGRWLAAEARALHARSSVAWLKLPTHLFGAAWYSAGRPAGCSQCSCSHLGAAVCTTPPTVVPASGPWCTVLFLVAGWAVSAGQLLSQSTGLWLQLLLQLYLQLCLPLENARSWSWRPASWGKSCPDEAAHLLVRSSVARCGRGRSPLWRWREQRSTQLQPCWRMHKLVGGSPVQAAPA